MRKHSKEYDNYMKSDAWAAKREERLKLKTDIRSIWT